MALYESVIIGRQDLTPNQFEELIDEFIKTIVSFKGVIKKRENWGLRNLAYKINKNRKGHYEAGSRGVSSPLGCLTSVSLAPLVFKGTRDVDPRMLERGRPRRG